MLRDATVLFEEFGRAQQAAIELTDRYWDCRVGDPRRPMLWDEVMRQTEAARQLLEQWLCCPQAGQIPPVADAQPGRRRELVKQN
jgi:hypothetical protein